MDHAILVLIASVIGGGVAGGLLNVWGLALRIYRLERHVIEHERVQIREVKQRAAGERWTKPARDLELLAHQLQAANKQPAREKFDNDWEG